MDDVDWALAANDPTTPSYDHSYIPGGWLEPDKSVTTSKRKAAFDLPAAKRPSPSPSPSIEPRYFLQTLKSILPVRIIQRIFNIDNDAKDDQKTARNTSSLSSQPSSEANLANSRELTRGPESRYPGHLLASYASIERSPNHRRDTSPSLAQQAISQTHTTFTDSFRSSAGHRLNARDLRTMYSETKEARRLAIARAALLQVNQPRKNQLRRREDDVVAERRFAIPEARPKLVPISTSFAPSTSNPPSPSLQLFNELELSLQPVDENLDSDTDMTRVDPSWMVPPKLYAKMERPADVAVSHKDSKQSVNHENPLSTPQFPPAMSRRIRPILSANSSVLKLIESGHLSPANSTALGPAGKTTDNTDSSNPNDVASSAVGSQKESMPATESIDHAGAVTQLSQLRSVSGGVVENNREMPNSFETLLDVSKLSIADDVPHSVDTPKASGHSGEKQIRLTRAQLRKKQLEEEALNQFEIVPLSAEWDAKVRQAVRQGHGSYASSDLARAVPEYAGNGQDNWLNDEVINGYLTLVTSHGKKNDRPNQTPSYHAFNSFFYNNLTSKGPESVMRWSKRPKINGTNLLNVTAVFIPINTGVHWTLAVVEPKMKTITHYNSMRSTSLGVTACAHIQKWVAKELGKDFNDEEWILVAVGESPQQTNSDDCGVFTITSARQIMLGFKPMSYRSDQMRVQRKRIVAELINGGLLKSRESLEE